MVVFKNRMGSSLFDLSYGYFWALGISRPLRFQWMRFYFCFFDGLKAWFFVIFRSRWQASFVEAYFTIFNKEAAKFMRLLWNIVIMDVIGSGKAPIFKSDLHKIIWRHSSNGLKWNKLSTDKHKFKVMNNF